MSVAKSLQRLLPKQLPPSLATAKPGNLYQVLSRHPDGGIGHEVHQTRWSSKHQDDCFWLVTRSRFKCEGNHGRVWGVKFWKGNLVSPREEEIRGGLKYKWAEGRSQAPPPPKAPKTLPKA